MKFVDLVEIDIKAGDGGKGMCHFHKEKFVPMGGPDGGNGGKGGDVVARGDSNLGTLLDFRYKRTYEANAGTHGKTNLKTGKNADPLIIRVPLGTEFYDVENNLFLSEITEDGQEFLLAKGGRGGLGNAHFTSSRNQAPEITRPPESGESKTLRLELKLIADIGIIGLPNAGKSTLISVISKAKPKIADYPFTTLTPNLGVVTYKNSDAFVVADVPGLLAGASRGKGLGFQFLRHIQRTKTLIHLIDAQSLAFDKIIEDFNSLTHELISYDKNLLKKPRIVVLSKMDSKEELSQPKEDFIKIKQYMETQGLPFFAISAINRIGLDELLEAILKTLDLK